MQVSAACGANAVPSTHTQMMPGSQRRIRWRALLAVVAVLYSSVYGQPVQVADGDDRVPVIQHDRGTVYRARVEAIWAQNISRELHAQYCDTATGEEVGWLISPILDGLYYGYLATANTQWIDKLIDCTGAWIRRAVVEPDGYPGWPKVGAAGTPVDSLDSYYADSLLGEAMALRPVVLLSSVIMHDPPLRYRYGAKAEEYLSLAQLIFRKWQSRGAWRPVPGGSISVELPFGIDPGTGGWTKGYASRNSPDVGFSHPANKANLVASWLLAMFDATGDPAYRELAADWFQVMKSRLKITDNGTYRIWNYWEPAGPWDYTPLGIPKHWIGVHSNAGYYAIDVNAIVAAYTHGLAFTAEDVERLVRTSAERISVWPALAPYDPETRRRLEQSIDPRSWEGLTLVPWYLGLLEHRVQ
ncbi:MAG: hypothetical protein ACJ8AI_32425 [Rhodopila sp.]